MIREFYFSSRLRNSIQIHHQMKSKEADFPNRERYLSSDGLVANSVNKITGNHGGEAFDEEKSFLGDGRNDRFRILRFGSGKQRVILHIDVVHLLLFFLSLPFLHIISSHHFLEKRNKVSA